MRILVCKHSYVRCHRIPSVNLKYDDEQDFVAHQWYVPCSVEIESVEEKGKPTELAQRLSEIEGDLQLDLRLQVINEAYACLDILDNEDVICNIFKCAQVAPNHRNVQMTVEIELQDEVTVTFNDCTWNPSGHIGFSAKDISYNTAWKILTPRPDVVQVSAYLNLPKNADHVEAEVRVVNQKILKDSLHTDFSIVTKENVVIACHKCHLAVGSSVLKREIEGNFEEGQADKIHMDYNTETVQALLDYIYFRSVAAAKDSCRTALELLKASDYYHVSGLWNDVLKIFQEMDSDWFDLKVALELFGFILKFDHLDIAKHLANKMVEVVASKNYGLEEFNFYQVFKDDPSALNSWIVYSCSYIFPKQEAALEESQ